MSEHVIEPGQLAQLGLLKEIRDALVKGEHWAGAGEFREVEVGATVKAVALTATGDKALVGGNRFRRGLIIYNDTAATIYVKYGHAGEGASSTDYSFQLAAGTQVFEGEYPGPIRGILASGTGNARVTEW